jgi:uncharacterized protein YdiU (UPF0061 family)
MVSRSLHFNQNHDCASQRVGFVHGVMNTDNMSILGLTIDYGPYGWLEDYNPDWTPNTTDAEQHRYAFGKQASIAQWNLLKLAQAIAPLFEDVSPLQEILNDYTEQYQTAWQNMMAKKLGLKSYHKALTDQLLETLVLAETDMTIFFRLLSGVQQTDTPQDSLDTIKPAFYTSALPEDIQTKWLIWLHSYIQQIKKDDTEHSARQESMNATNPKYVLRNYLAQLAIDKAEQGDLSILHELLDVLRFPYDEQEGKESFAEKRPDWARERAGCSMLSCSS